MACRASPIAIAVMAFRHLDRTETQTDIAPSWISEAAMAPAVIEARKGVNMGLLLRVGGTGEKKAPWTVKSRALGGKQVDLN